MEYIMKSKSLILYCVDFGNDETKILIHRL